MSQQAPTKEFLSLPGFGDEESSLGSKATPPPVPRWRRRRVLWIVVVLLLILVVGTIFAISSQPLPVRYQTHTVSTGDLSINIGATGPIQSGVYNIIFSGTGIIEEISVKVGDKVTKGQVLAQLDKTALQDAVDQQQASLDGAKADLNAAIASLNATQNQGGVSASVQQTAVANAQNNLNAAQNQAQASVAQAEQQLSSDEQALQQAEVTAQANIDAAQAALNDAEQNLTQTQQSSDASKQLAAQQFEQEKAACSTTDPNCVQVAQAKYDQAVAQADLSVSQAQQQVTTAQNNLTNAEIQGQQNIATAQARVDASQKALELAKTNATTNNTTAQSQFDTTKGQMDTTQAGNDVSIQSAQAQVTSAQNQVTQALKQLETAKHNLENATLKAPQDGTVTMINGTVGGVPGVPLNTTSASASGGNTFIQIIDTSKLQIIANVNEADTANLKPGQQSTFSVNSFGERQFKGTVSAISPNGQTVANVVTYPVYIDVDMKDLKGMNLFPGMTANVSITVINRTGVLLMPVNAVNFARLASNGNPAAGIPQLITRQQANNALIQARQKLLELQEQNPDLLAQNPLPAYVLTQVGEEIVPQPVVLGLTDGTAYEMLYGPEVEKVVLTGIASEDSLE